MSSRNPNTPVSAKKTAKTRITEFGSKFLVARGEKLFCKFCNSQIDFSRKSSIVTHLNSSSHISTVTKSKTFFERIKK